MCIAHEDAERGASLERLILSRDWEDAAELLEAGDAIPFKVLGPEAAMSLAARMPTWLRLDRDGDFWNVSDERPEQPRRLFAGEHEAVRA